VSLISTDTNTTAMAKLVARTAATLLCGGVVVAPLLVAGAKAGQCDAGDGSCDDSEAYGGRTAGSHRNDDAAAAPNSHGANDALPRPGRCALFLAPSSLPHAGLGLFSGATIPFDHPVNEYIGGTFAGYDDDVDPPLWTDMFIPLGDPYYKALPYRGQQRFPSWLGYVWPEEPEATAELTDTYIFSFPAVPSHVWDFDMGLNDADGLEFYADDLNDVMFQKHLDFEPSEKVSALVPGIASLANGGGVSLSNLDRIYENSRSDYGGQEAPWHPGAGAFTPHHGIDFLATRDIEAGTELLIDYGEKWNWNNRVKQKRIAKKEKENAERAEAGEDVTSDSRPKKGFVDGIHRKWDPLIKYEHTNQMEYELPTEKAKREGLAEGVARDSSEFSDDEKPYSEYRLNDFFPEDHNDVEEEDDDEHKEYPDPSTDITKSMSWLGENGVCLSSGKLRIRKSPIQYAGRGVFATGLIRRGEVVLPSPLIAMREEDFTIYKSDENAKIRRNIVDKSKVIGVELLFNYAFTHPDSPLYLVPTAPLANFINHGGKRKPGVPGANVKIRWPEAGSAGARLFEWAYNQKYRSHFDNDFENYPFGTNHNAWLRDHPIDVMERSGRLALEYVALRDIREGEEILIDYGKLWLDAWSEFKGRNPYARSGYFRHAIGVPDGFYPENWLHVSDQYQIAEIQDLENKPLEPGAVVPMTWAHNGKPVGSKYAYVVGLEKGFSDRFLEYSERRGVIELYRRLLAEEEGYRLQSDGFDMYRPGTLVNATSEEERLLEFFAHRYKSDKYRFNMHFVAAWDELARKDLLRALGDAGFDIAVRGVGERFGYDNMTCFHTSYMGMTHCDKSLMHSDIYATNDKSWNMVFPLITIEGTEPELSVMSEDINTIVGVNYLKDVAYAMGDFGYHQTRMVAYYDPDDDSLDVGDDVTRDTLPIRVVFGAYCSQIDETNVAVIRHIYDGDDPAPFADQFKDVPMREVHWEKDAGTSTLAKPGGKGF